jgi:hypothetical protein
LLPLRRVPSLRSCIARFTLSCAFFPYRLAMSCTAGSSGRRSAAMEWHDGRKRQSGTYY